MLEFDNMHRASPAIPSVFFTHGNYLRDYTGIWDNKSPFYPKKVLILVRDPRDVAVSQYFQWKFRMRPVKRMLNDYPERDDLSIYEFMMNPEAGLPKIIEFLEIWQRELPKVRESLVLRYEDMRAQPEGALRRALDFLGTPGSDEQIREAAAYASYDNMKKLEEKHVFSLERHAARTGRCRQSAVLQGAARQGRRLARLFRRRARSPRSTPCWRRGRRRRSATAQPRWSSSAA